MSSPHHLHGFSLATVRSAPNFPALFVADSVTGIPELRRHARIRAISKKTRLLSLLDLITELRPELEVQSHVVDAPGAIRFHVHAVIGIRDDVLSVPGAGLQRNVRHSDQRDAVPAICTHTTVALKTEFRCGLTTHQITDKLPVFHQWRA